MIHPNDYLLDPKWLNEHFNYHPDGYLIRIKRDVLKGGNTFIGQKIVGTQHHTGYMYMRIKTRMMAFHRVVFTLVNGRPPSNDIDHIDRNQSNNKIENLREATPTQNSFNTKIHKRNTSGHRGVFWDKKDKLWYAAIQLDGKRKRLKFSKDKEKVIQAYKEAALKYRGDWYHAAN